MKKAFLVTAVVKTRVVVDVDDNYDGTEFAYYYSNENDDKIINESFPRLKDNLSVECIDEVVLDTECPYDEEFDEYF